MSQISHFITAILIFLMNLKMSGTRVETFCIVKDSHMDAI